MSTNYLEISVRTNSAFATGFITLAPRQVISPTPFAYYAPESVRASSVIGFLPANALPGLAIPYQYRQRRCFITQSSGGYSTVGGGYLNKATRPRLHHR